jgi:hypothetical protein
MNLNDVEKDPIDAMYLDIMEKLKELHNGRKLLLPKQVKKIVDQAYYKNSPDDEVFEDENEDENLEIQDDE